MLKTPELFHNDPVISAIARLSRRNGGVKIIEEGVLEIGHFDLDILVWGQNAPDFYMGYPDIPGVNSYGVCDTPQQFLKKYRTKLTKDKRTFVLGFTHIEKDPNNAGKGGGWRWHKWGPYIGKGKPTTEYLDDEKRFDNGVYVYHIVQIDGPALSLKNFKLVPMEKSVW